MNAQTIKVLLVEDDPDDAYLVRLFLEEETSSPFVLEVVPRLEAGLRRLADESFDVVLLDLQLPDGAGLDTFREALARAGPVPIVVLSGADHEADALEAVRLGAQDYLVKGRTDSHRLVRSLRFAIERTSHVKRLAPELAEFSARLDDLTPREREVLDHIAEGKSLKQIALALGTSYNTVKNQRSRILEKLAAQSESDLVRLVLLVRLGTQVGVTTSS